MNNLTVNNSLFAKPTLGRSEYGRVKVALAPGKGFMDWLRLTTNKTLAKRQASVDHIELMKHNKKDDCWVLLFGIVYDVTKYLEFHPGGIPELLRGAGRDATPLFNQYHAWVNYESMLKACIVGPFTGDSSKLPAPLPPTTTEDSNLLGPSAGFGDSDNLFGSIIQTLENGVCVEHKDWTNLTDKNVVVSITSTLVKTAITTKGEEMNSEQSKLRIYVHHFWKPSMEFEFEANALLNNQRFEVKVTPKKVEVTFPDVASGCSEVLSQSKVKVQRRPGVSYHSTTISSIDTINHDTLLYKLDIPKNTHFRIPVGHHVLVKVRKGNAVLYRPYTPVLANCDDLSKMELMIKVYSDGICTPSLEKLKSGDTLEISDPIGDKSYTEWIQNAQTLILIAAGTGITPMIDIMKMRFESRKDDTKVYLIMFNKTDKDVQSEGNGWIVERWKKEYGEDQENVVIRDILTSAPDDSVLHGRVSSALLRQIIPSISPKSTRAFICGPDGFMMAAKESLESMGIPSDDMHIFQG